MLFHHHHRRSGGYSPPTSWYGKLIQCLYSGSMFCAMGTVVWLIWTKTEPWTYWFVLVWAAVMTAALLTGMILMVIMFYCTVTEKMF